MIEQARARCSSEYQGIVRSAAVSAPARRKVAAEFQRLKDQYNLTTKQVIYAATYHNEDTWLDGKTIKTMDELIDWVSDTFVSFPFDERFDEESRAAAARQRARMNET